MSGYAPGGQMPLCLKGRSQAAALMEGRIGFAPAGVFSTGRVSGLALFSGAGAAGGGKKNGPPDFPQDGQSGISAFSGSAAHDSQVTYPQAWQRYAISLRISPVMKTILPGATVLIRMDFPQR
jgi:hypothetical protein